MRGRAAEIAVWAAITSTISLIAVAAVILWPGPFDLLVNPWMISSWVFAACGALIVTRRSTHPIGWLFTVYGLLTSAGLVCFSLGSVLAHSETAVGWTDAAGNALATPAVLAIPAALLHFPDGSLPSSRWRWVRWMIAIAAVVGAAAALTNGGWGGDSDQALAESPLRSSTRPWGEVASQLFYSLMVVTMTVSGLSLMSRFRSARGDVRQQMKWLAVAAAYLITALMLAVVTGGTAELSEGWNVVLVAGAFASVPAAVAVAVLRYRLYDIDRIINRTIVYGLVTGSAVAVYAATVFVAGTVVVGPSDNLTVAIATLAAAAVFRPALGRVQAFVDRRFYRSRFDAQHTIAEFGSRLRRQTDLDQLTADLVGVVRETIQPATVSLWLRNPEGAP